MSTCLSVCESTCLKSTCVCLRACACILCDASVVWLCLTLLLSLCSIRNASGLTAADLAYAQGFQECAEILSNAQNFQQNMTQSHNGVFLNGTAQNGSHTHPTIQGRSFLNGVTNRKRSFEDTEANPVKKARPNGMSSHNISACDFTTCWGNCQCVCVRVKSLSKNMLTFDSQVWCFTNSVQHRTILCVFKSWRSQLQVLHVSDLQALHGQFSLMRSRVQWTTCPSPPPWSHAALSCSVDIKSSFSPCETSFM